MSESNINKKSLWNIITILKIYGVAVFIFFLFRLALFIVEYSKVDDAPFSDIIQSFIMGVRFDIVICGYVLFFPYIALTLNHFLFESKLLNKIVFYFIFSILTISFIISSADIPYFIQFFSRFNINAFEWMDQPLFVAKMLLEEPQYWIFMIPCILLIWLLFKVLKKIILSEDNSKFRFRPIFAISTSIIFAGLIFIGVRGRIEKKSPIRIGTAYIFDNAFLNQLGLNPNFTFIRSYLDYRKEENKPIHLMDENEAIKNIQEYLEIHQISDAYPLMRVENDSVQPRFENVVIILMESMSANKMSRHGNTKNLTPFLDSLSENGIYFENAYSAGIHTHNGIFSTLFSIPAIFNKHSMKGSEIPKYPGIATTLKKHGYSTIYFETHDAQFDNVQGFLRGNDFERIVEGGDYPREEIKTSIGVPDAYMFEFSIPILNDLHKKNKPFLSVFMTSSDHGPYYVPEYFKARNSNIREQATEFADYSLKKFITEAKKQTWFNNTLFVFLGDHGAAMDADYDVSLAYNHIPLLFYAPKLISDHKILDNMIGQIDVFPSIMGFLGIPFENNTLGINQFKDSRPYIFFNVDDRYGVIDKEWLLIVKKEGDIGLYKYQNKDKKNYAKDYPQVVTTMKTYAETNIQAAQYLRNLKY